MKKEWKSRTKINHDGSAYAEHKGAIVPPIYQNSLFAFDGWDAIEQAFDNPEESYIYSRLHNPTSRIVEKKIADMAGGEDAKLTGSGMGAISAAILHFVKAGDHIITIKDIYGPATSFIGSFLSEKCNIESTFVDGRDIANIKNAIRENTTLIYLESPASLTFALQDIRAVAQLAKQHHIKTVIDNTFCTPLWQRPLEMGIDMEVHSASKYFCGHSDVVAGVIIGKKSDLASILVKEHALLGAKAAPFESWLLLRSLRTLPFRLAALEKSATQIAHFLEAHEKIKRVYYTGLKSFEQYDLAQKQMSGNGSLISLVLDTTDLSEIKAFVDTLEVFHLGVSWGGHESLVYAPVISYTKELSPEQFANKGIIPGLIRISVGLEDTDDLISDLNNALNCLK